MTVPAGRRVPWTARPAPPANQGSAQLAVVGAVAAAALLMVAVLAIPMMVAGGAGMVAGAGPGCSGQKSGTVSQAAVSGQARHSLPATYLGLYQKIGRQYGVPWVVLAGIGTVESDNGQSNMPGVRSGANAFGAAGPMQIGIGGASGNNWGGAPAHPAGEQVGGVATDENGDGTASVYEPADAIAGTAKYLVQHGGQSDMAAAIFAYNHLQSYVQSVLYWAGVYSRGGYSATAVAAVNPASGAGTAACTAVSVTGGNAGGSGAVPNRAAATTVAFAQQQMGKPYVWGATGPDTFDCSGLVMMAYRAAGVDIPRTSQEQWAWGPKITGHPEPGDLVFFAGADGTPSSPGHVGLVIGGGKMIEAYATGYPVRIASYAGRDPIGFTRPWAHAGVALPGQRPAS